MTVYVPSQAGSRVRTAPAEPFDLLVPVFCVCLAVRFFIPASVLELFESYTTTGGAVYEKVHPGAYLMFLLTAYNLLTRPVQPTAADRAVQRGSLIFLSAIASVSMLGLATGRTQGFSYLLDSLALGPIVCLTMVRLSDRNKYTVLTFVLCCFVVNASILFPEFVLKTRVLPYQFVEATFRPTAFLGHPLANGLVNATAIAFLWVTRWTFPTKILLSLFFVVACFVSQARMASIFSTLSLLACAWIFLSQSVRERKIDEGTLVVSAIVTLGILLTALVVIIASGFADRLLKLGLFNDASSQARFTVYNIFKFMTHGQLMFGMPRVLAEYYITQTLHLLTSESSLVDYVVQFGIVGTTILIGALLNFLRQLAVASRSIYVWIGVVVFLAVASTNNTFSGKGPAATIITVLAIGALGARQSMASSARSRVPSNVLGERVVGLTR